MWFKITGPKGGVIVARASLKRLTGALSGLVRRFGRVTVAPTPGPPPKPTPAPTPAPAPAPAPRLPLLGLDYETGPAPAALCAAGVHFVCRYVSTAGNPKNLTPAEAKELRKAGLAIVLVFETVSDRALAGYQAGAADARSARAQTDACGYPKSAAIYFAVDFDAQPGQLAKVVSYIRGAASVLTPARTGVYGGLAAVRACLDAKVCRFGWQTLAWSGGEWEPRAQLRQVAINETLAGHGVDRNEAVQARFGQWGG